MARRRGQAVTFEGLDELLRDLADLGPEIIAATMRAVEAGSEQIRDDTRAGVRVDTGALRAGVEAIVNRKRQEARIGWRDPKLYYVLFEEFGTSSIPANPALFTAAEAERVRFPDRVAAEVRKAITS
jgi:HK97 gp10 family phage protein